MLKSSLTGAAVALSLGFLLPASASASVLNGADVNAQWQFATLGTTYLNYGDMTVGTGIEYVNVDVDDRILFDVDLADTSITVNFNPSIGGFAWADFNGLFITDLDGVFPSLSVSSIVANGFDFLLSDVLFTSNGFGLNFQGDDFDLPGDQSLTVNFAVAAVPLPATLPLLLAALGGFAALRRKQRTNSAAA